MFGRSRGSKFNGARVCPGYIRENYNYKGLNESSSRQIKKVISIDEGDLLSLMWGIRCT